MNFLIAILICGIASFTHPTHAKPTSTHRIDLPSKIIFHKRISYFIDVEAPIDQVWVGCTEATPVKTEAWLVVYVLIDTLPYSFQYRRSLTNKQCLQEEREFHRIIRGAKSVRVVGILPSESSRQGYAPERNVPARFAISPKQMSLILIRLQANNQCKAFFSNDCLPENYWAGMTPSP